jgi:large subunit ribosomal protein L9
MDLQKSLEEKGLSVDRHNILLDEPIKALGIYRIPVKVTSELSGEIKVYVITT